MGRGRLSHDFATVPRHGADPIATFYRLGIIDTVWTLGGQVCRSMSLCVLPILHIIEDCSYVLLRPNIPQLTKPQIRYLPSYIDKNLLRAFSNCGQERPEGLGMTHYLRPVPKPMEVLV
ncbi:hypothetical protein BKA82DRAFT_992026 [Pisolithus tinctorius]|uniref:Uncharacterized protein n=1 Tax=Pisolithus tinctorius Marx 270 TaxID=870435 RepID=A0A0C3PI94_PISTI|nr:hypothetical protein BKA82DRAFT_992026 [Pisolithus tinctorius]KIO13800.1 hypothetical protein M404DRAFT_992026 [Pisolithus tinctorius Marx 270]